MKPPKIRDIRVKAHNAMLISLYDDGAITANDIMNALAWWNYAPTTMSNVSNNRVQYCGILEASSIIDPSSFEKLTYYKVLVKHRNCVNCTTCDNIKLSIEA